MNKLLPYLYRVVDIVLFGNLFIALCAVGLVYTSYEWLGIPLKIDTLVSFVFASTIFQYTLHRFLALRARKEVHNSVVEWSKSNQFLLFMLALGSGGVAANLAFHLNPDTLKALIPLGFISLLYEIPFKFNGQTYKLRNTWFFKTILIVLVWTFTSVLFPCLEYDKNIFTTSFILLFAYRAVMIFMLAVAFDIRDFDYDRAEGVNTIPVAMGLHRMKKLFQILTGILIVLALMRIIVYDTTIWPSIIASVITPLIAYRIITMSHKKPHEYFYNIVVDGIMLVELIITVLLNRIF